VSTKPPALVLTVRLELLSKNASEIASRSQRARSSSSCPRTPHVGYDDLKGVSKLTTLLKKREDPATGFKELRPTWKLNSANCFGPTFPVKDEEIHVLMKVPIEGPPAKRQRTDEVLSGMAQKLDRLCELLTQDRAVQPLEL
jgi:hypothetical protein